MRRVVLTALRLAASVPLVVVGLLCLLNPATAIVFSPLCAVVLLWVWGYREPETAPGAYGPTQSQLLAEQNRILAEMRDRQARPAASRPAERQAPPEPPAWAGKGIAGYLDSLR